MLGSPGRRAAHRVLVGALAASAVPVATQYWLPGQPGFGLDMLAFLVAYGAAAWHGRSLLHADGIPVWCPWLLLLAFPVTLAWGVVVSGYVPPAGIMGLVVAYAVGGARLAFLPR